MKVCYNQYHEEREIGWLDWYQTNRVAFQSTDEIDEELDVEAAVVEGGEKKRDIKPLEFFF